MTSPPTGTSRQWKRSKSFRFHENPRVDGIGREQRVRNREDHGGWGALPTEWAKYGLAALVIHAVVVAIPVTHKATRVAKQRVIDVIVMRHETPPPRPPIPEKKVAEPKLIAKAKTVEPVKTEPTPTPQKMVEKREAPPSGGGGNAIDEHMVAHVNSGPATGGGEGVAVSGVNVGGGKVGLGSGSGTGSGQGPGVSTTVVAPPLPPPPVETTGPMEARIGEGDGPQWIRREVPEYPFAAKKLGREGRFELKVTIDEKGRVQNIDVVSATDASFGQAAMEAVKRSKIAPAKHKGNPIPSWFKCTYRFGLS
jgi:periplasmic protein TonB